MDVAFLKETAPAIAAERPPWLPLSRAMLLECARFIRPRQGRQTWSFRPRVADTAPLRQCAEVEGGGSKLGNKVLTTTRARSIQFWQARRLPSLSAASAPQYTGVTKRDKPKSKIATVKSVLNSRTATTLVSNSPLVSVCIFVRSRP